MKRLCRDCPHCKHAKSGLISERYWCGLTGDGWNGKALGVYPWKNKPHPKCPLKEDEREIKPCPFCGGRAGIVYREPIFGHYVRRGTYYVHCTKCLITTMPRKSADAVIETWNRR